MHFGDTVSSKVEFVGDEFVGLVQRGGQGTAPFQPAMSGFDMFVKDLRGIEGLPLTIRQIAPAAPALRYTSVEVPLSAVNEGMLMDPADVVVQFESSGRWPDDLVAIQKTKIAFLLKIAELLDVLKGKEIYTRIGLENEMRPTMNAAFLDVIYLSGPAFRVRIYHDREQTLLQRQLKNKDLSGKKRDEISATLSEHRRKFIVAPLHTQEIQKLAHRFPALSPSIRLLKKWFNTHLLIPHVSGELVELLAVRNFVSAHSPPASIMAGFLQTLRYIANWDWRREPMVVDLSAGEMEKAVAEGILKAFEETRKTDPGMNHVVMFVGSGHDIEGRAWTEGAPMKVVAARITTLARSVCDAAEGSISALFTPSLKDYDFILRLDPKYTAAGVRTGKKKPVYKNLQTSQGVTEQDIMKLGLDPASMFLKELNVRSSFGRNLGFMKLANGRLGYLRR
jgi:U3 small nucleolar RNA-associated protein 22